jgi:hypothetical protein
VSNPKRSEIIRNRTHKDGKICMSLKISVRYNVIPAGVITEIGLLLIAIRERSNGEENRLHFVQCKSFGSLSKGI